MWRNLTRVIVPMIGVVALLALPAGASAQTAEAPERGRIAATFGFSQWSDAGDIQPFPGADFDEAGFALDLAFHWPVGQLGSATVLAGANIGGFFHGSNIPGIEEGEDLEASVVYLTPSVKVAFGEPGGRRFYIDAGVGYYGASIDELEEDCFFSCDIYEYYDDDALGGYVGLSADFPFGSRVGGFRLTTSAEVHFVDFDAPVELDSDATLDGPVYTLQVGLAWGP
jgi:hypothetical protein